MSPDKLLIDLPGYLTINADGIPAIGATVFLVIAVVLLWRK